MFSIVYFKRWTHRHTYNVPCVCVSTQTALHTTYHFVFGFFARKAPFLEQSTDVSTRHIDPDCSQLNTIIIQRAERIIVPQRANQ